MPRFSYEAKKGPKEIVSGTIEAVNQNAAVEKLTQLGYVPIRVAPEAEGVRKEQSLTRSRTLAMTAHPFATKVRSREVTIFTEQLSSLVKSKVPLLEAMKVLYDQTESQNFKKIIGDMLQQIRDGQTLTKALSAYPKCFPLLYVNMINSGELGGVLEKTLLHLAEFRNKEEEIRAKVSASLAYPVFIVFVGVITVFVLLGFVIPRMAEVFADIGQALPLPTRLLLSLSDKVKHYWYWALIVVALAAMVLKRASSGKKEKVILDGMKLRIPLVGGFLKQTVIASFSRTLGLLIANGIPVFQALKITIPTLENEIFKSELEKVHRGIIDGMTLEQSLRKSPWFPHFMTNMLAVGERGGNLEESLQEIANFYEREVDKTTKMMTALLEPAIILVMGLVVGFIVFAMLLPIFQINMAVK